MLRFLQVLCIAPVFPLRWRRSRSGRPGKPSDSSTRRGIGAAFIGPVVATTLLSSMPPAAVYLVLAGMGLSVILLSGAAQPPRAWPRASGAREVGAA